MSAATARRPVRVTLEGEAYRPSPGADDVLMVVLPSGHKVCLTEGLGITVEDVEPPRVWTDGDVVLIWNSHDRTGTPIVMSRHGGAWTNHLGSRWDESDVEAALQSIAPQSYRSGMVLRYQHGGDA